jgi:two-component system, cell cycle response regulator
VNERDKPGGRPEPSPKPPADSAPEEEEFEERRHETISMRLPRLAPLQPAPKATRDETVRGPLKAIVESQAVPEHACLVVLRGRHLGQLFELGDEPAILGRGEDATIQVDDTATSRHHARIEPTAIGYLIVDLESTNGTLVNGHNISRHVLRDGDRVQVGGETVLEFSYRDEVQTGVQRRLFESATRDPLTGLHNRGYFLEALDEAFAHARRLKRPLSLLLLDIDNFKRVNDTYGHPTGDAVLQQFADLIRDLVRREDVPTRYGGEEFVMMLRESGLSGCRLLGDRIRERVERRPFQHAGAALSLTVSVGGATYWNGNYQSPAQLLEAADAAVYQAKGAGRNRVVIKIDDAPATPRA